MLISIVIAAYNVEKYVARCLNSVLNQNFNDYEIIIVNDCSTDRTLQIINEIASENDKIKVINKDKNEGLSEARNSGLSIASGKYVAFIDGDDFVEKNTYKTCCIYAESINADEVVFESTYDKKNGEQWYMSVNSSKDVYSTESEINDYFREMIGAEPKSTSDYQIGFTPWGRIYRRAVLVTNRVKFISERKYIYEDLVFALNIMPYIKKVGIVHEPFYHYCENDNSLTKKIDINRYYRIKEMYNYIKTLEIYKRISSELDIKYRFNRTMLAYIRLSIIQLCIAKRLDVVNKISKDEMCSQVIEGYPINKLPFKQRIFAYMLKHRYCKMMYLMIRLKMKGIGK